MMLKSSQVRLSVAITFLTILLSGCATSAGSRLKGWIGPESSLFGGGRVTSAGVNQLFDETLETKSFLLSGSITNEGGEKEPLLDGKESAGKEPERNNLQDRIIAAANQRCGLYQTYLKQLQGKTDLSLGILATVLGGVGAIVTAADTARALSGAAGITSGARAEFNQAILLNSAIPIIIKGIEKRREKLKKAMLEQRAKPIEEYTAALAMADAIDYHNACTLGKGLEEADAALEFAKNPGLEAFTDAFSEAPAFAGGKERKIKKGCTVPVLIVRGGPVIEAKPADATTSVLTVSIPEQSKGMWIDIKATDVGEAKVNVKNEKVTATISVKVEENQGECPADQ